jgi:hypothetical protein
VSQAVRCGIAIRDAAAASTGDTPDEGSMRVGVGIHAGEVEDGEDGIVSSAVNIAARVCAVAEPGEVLVTETVRGLVRGSLRLAYAPRGRPRLKGIAEPIALFAVGAGDAAAAAPRRTVGSRVAIGAAFVGGIAVVVLVALMRPGDGADGTTGQASATPSASPSVSATEPEETHDLGRFNDPGEFPNGYEADLLDRLPAALTSSCTRADASLYPVTYVAADVGAMPHAEPANVRAGVTCLTGGNTATYLQLGSRANVRFSFLDIADEIFHGAAERRTITEGSCATGTRAWSEWASGAHTGHVMCFAREGEAVLEWTYTAPNVYAIASRRDGDAAALFTWWEDIGRRLSR